ncbi:P-loop NTPase family protein [Mycoplasmoides alvi]|uniref:tyrosine-protein kinase family protein n=1 Tax=Mycoplasmoides alvi TaxID=78580 RepID=UPI00051C1176|nr:tyrosine-protein kinase family protein [Mycoplasmoides alvi]
MTIIGIMSSTDKTGKTSVALGLADSLIVAGNNVLFINLNYLCQDNSLLTTYCNGTFTNYVNKQNKIQDIITRVHSINLDLINLQESDYKWLMSMDKNSLSTLISNFLKTIYSFKKYDFVIINFFESVTNKLNKILFNHLNNLFFIINPLEFENQNLNLLFQYAQIKTNKKIKFHLLFNKFIEFSKKTMQVTEHCSFAFSDALIEYHIPIIKELIYISNMDELIFTKIWLTKTRKFFIKIVHLLGLI